MTSGLTGTRVKIAFKFLYDTRGYRDRDWDGKIGGDASLLEA
jgi:hypothetical protein